MRICPVWFVSFPSCNAIVFVATRTTYLKQTAKSISETMYYTVIFNTSKDNFTLVTYNTYVPNFFLAIR